MFFQQLAWQLFAAAAAWCWSSRKRLRGEVPRTKDLQEIVDGGVRKAHGERRHGRRSKARREVCCCEDVLFKAMCVQGHTGGLAASDEHGVAEDGCGDDVCGLGSAIAGN